MLHERGADINASNFEGHTALHIAFESGSDKLVSFIREKGGRPCASTRCQRCKIHLKLLGRREARAKAAKKNMVNDHRKQEATAQVLEEEFGEIDLNEEIQKMKAAF
eukprot:UC1_evm1s1627